MRDVRAPRLYAIADWDVVAGLTPESTNKTEAYLDVVGELVECGIEWIQIRAKRLADGHLYELVERVAERFGTNCSLWIDDRVDVAALLPVAGVHLGQHDLAPAAARSLLGAGCWIGLSTHDLEQVEKADADQSVDVIAFGPVFETSNKVCPDPTVGLASLMRARALTSKPLVAIGGIDAGRAASVFEAGADTVAAIGAFCAASPRAQWSDAVESYL